MERHPVEQEMGLTAQEILDVVQRNDRVYQMIRGVVAEWQLDRLLQRLKQAGKIDSFEHIMRDGQPDFRITVGPQTLRLECKHVRTEHGVVKTFKNGERSVDFQRTRNQLKGRAGRHYKPDDFELLATAEHSSDGEWTFKFIRTEHLPTSTVEGQTVFDTVVHVPADTKGTHWGTELTTVLDTGAARSWRTLDERQKLLAHPP